MPNQQLAEESLKPIIEKFENVKVCTHHSKIIFGSLILRICN